jgi:glycine/D-amino acid oxidase-like deaminating enzyme
MRYTTKPIEGVAPDMPLLIFPDCYGFYIREERGGLLIGGTDPGELHEDRKVDPLTPPQSGDIVSSQVRRVREYIRDIEDVMPALGEAEIDQVNGGLPTFTSDTRFIVDEIPSQRGAYYVSGCNEGGITHGPALGKLVAELCIDGSSDWDCFRAERLSEAGESDH